MPSTVPAPVAQTAEHHVANVKATGSRPVRRSKYRGFFVHKERLGPNLSFADMGFRPGQHVVHYDCGFPIGQHDPGPRSRRRPGRARCTNCGRFLGFKAWRYFEKLLREKQLYLATGVASPDWAGGETILCRLFRSPDGIPRPVGARTPHATRPVVPDEPAVVGRRAVVKFNSRTGEILETLKVAAPEDECDTVDATLAKTLAKLRTGENFFRDQLSAERRSYRSLVEAADRGYPPPEDDGIEF
jgi:hypothetical protein